MRGYVFGLMFWLAGAVGAWAGPDVPQDVADLAAALGLPEMIEIMRLEGLDNGAAMADEMFPERGGPAWQAAVERIYDGQHMSDVVMTHFAEALQDRDLSALTEFFEGETGRKIVGLEISARRALLDDAVEEASKDRLAELTDSGDPFLDLVGEFVEENDLLEFNVVGAMNSNYAFYTGLQDGGAFDKTLTESQILSDVWSQEDMIRAETEEWLYAYLAMAYQPLSEPELHQYIDLSRTPEGQNLNRALFAAFDRLFVDMSHALGRAAAVNLIGQDL